MKFILLINGKESEDAGYVGWTPVKCTLTIDGYSGDSPMPVTITTGHYNLHGKVSLYDDNAISSLPKDKIQYDFQQNRELTFFIAGHYPHASVGRKDTFIQITAGSAEVEELRREIMVRVRKNANTLSEDEISMFLEAFVRLNTEKPKKEYQGDYTAKPSKLLHEIVLMHTLDAQYEIHMRTSFHPWHRVFQMHLERELQEMIPYVTIPYWKFDEKAERVFTSKFIGETESTDDENSPEKKQPKFDKMNPLINYVEHTVWGPLQRAYRKRNPADTNPDATDPREIYSEDRIIHGPDSSEYFLYWSQFEERRSHNRAHNVFTGHVVDIGRDPIDPLFFMMHSNVDRLWALWQEKHNLFDAGKVKTYPFQYKYAGERGQKWALLETIDAVDGIYQVNNDDIGNFAEDNLWPWDWDNVLSRPMRKWNSTSQGYSTGEVPQINIEFPKSPTSYYPDGTITVKSTIDYQGRLGNQIILGFDYDNIPYFDHDRKKSSNISMDEATDNNEFFQKINDMHLPSINLLKDKTNDLQLRLKTIGLIDETSEIFLDTILDIIADSSERAELRSELIDEMVAAKRANRFFPSRKPRFFDLLRGLITDNNKKLRFQAIEILASSQDEVVQEFLTDEIEKENSDFISKSDAIFFLRQNPKPQHATLFHKLFEESSDPAVKKAAIEGLGNDLNSVGLLEKVVLDAGESFKIREAGALSLHHLDHEAMNGLAAQILAEPESGDGIKLFRSTSPDVDEVDFKAGLLNMLTFTGDIDRLKQNDELKSSLKEVVDPNTANKANFRSSFEAFTAAPMAGPTIIEQMAAKLLIRLEGNDNE